MFIALNKLLNIDNKVTPKRKFFLLSESHNDASFLIHHFLSFYLKGGHYVCLIGLVQSFAHYSSVAQKLGLNLNIALQNGKLTFIEGLKYAVQSMKCGTSQMPNNPFVALSSREPRFVLKPLFEMIQEAVSKFEESRPYLVLIDDVSVFLSLGVSTTDIQDFIHYILVTVCAPEKSGCLVALVHADHDTDDSDEEILEKQLVYECDTQLHVKGLSTGFCREVHGQLEIIDHDIAMTTGRPVQKTVQYKIMDKNVTFFAPGNSASVL